MVKEVSSERQTGSAHTMPTQVEQPGRSGGHSPATLLGARYTTTRRIAVGGMGEVWAATDAVLGRQVAVKILRDELVGSPVSLARFRAEAKHTAALAHRGIASVFDYGEDDHDGRHIAYLVMELVPGRPLSRLIAESGPLPLTTALDLLAQAADALHAAHVAGVVHRDVKPGNLLVLDDGTLKVTDFGIARAANSAALTEVGQVIGTASYISPEQASGGEATAASDIYSLGVVGYEMLAGHPPFTADNPIALTMAHVHQAPPPLPDTVPAEVRNVIAAAMSKDPVDRPSDAAAFAADLRRLQTASVGEPTLVMVDDAPPPTAVMPAQKVVVRSPDLGMTDEAYSSRRQRRWIAAAVLVAIALFAFAQLSGTDIPIPAAGLPTTASTPAATSTLVAVDPNALIGLTVARASEILTRSGMRVRVERVDVLGVPTGTVTAVNPNGQVPVGNTVTLTVSNGAPASTSTTTTTTEARGNDKGKGHKPKG